MIGIRNEATFKATLPMVQLCLTEALLMKPELKSWATGGDSGAVSRSTRRTFAPT